MSIEKDLPPLSDDDLNHLNGEFSEEIITEDEDDEGDDQLDLPKSAFTPINFSTSARRIIDLYRSYREDNELDPRPSFQRGYVWDKRKATKLIESILLHVPLPLVYTAEEENGIEVVIDGQQRLTTCFSFIDGFFPLSKKDEERKKRGESVRQKPFKLGKMKILGQYEKFGYKDLPADLSKTINNFAIQVIKISKESHPEVKFEIFERLNTGSVALSDQEIRNCIYRGPYNELLGELANYSTFQKLLGINDSASRMQDVELVLRFMSFKSSTHLNYNEKMRAFLNSHMRERQNINNEMGAQSKREFMQACDLSFTVFGEKAFRRYSEGSESNPSGRWEKSINKAVFDVIMFWFAHYPKHKVVEKADQIREAFIKLCTSDREFSDSITLGTNDVGRVNTRFNKWGETMRALLDSNAPGRRLFSYAEKLELFEKEQTCGICTQRISHIDDAEVDHVIPHSIGGLTDLSNARLTHRYCNRARGNRI